MVYIQRYSGVGGEGERKPSLKRSTFVWYFEQKNQNAKNRVAFHLF